MKDHVRTRWERTWLVCRKCSKRIGGGFGRDGDERLAKALRLGIGAGKGRKARIGILEVGCLGICPKRAVVALDAARPGEWLLVAPGTPVAEVVARLEPALPAG